MNTSTRTCTINLETSGFATNLFQSFMTSALRSLPPEAAQTPELVVLKYNQRRVVVKRQRSYDRSSVDDKLMLDSVCKNFPDIPRDAVTLQTDKLKICHGHYVDIAAEAWVDVIDLLTVVEVVNKKEVNQKEVWRVKDNNVVGGLQWAAANMALK
ncbi:hypothetical protein P692DRAFT_20877546 [Suillus brevipes Sb2]|nr:hypothetical protein P692DRAFT_20877546 [Suillus brevipes Sb2]